jgi:transposase
MYWRDIPIPEWYRAHMNIDTPQRLCHLPLLMDVLRRSKVLEVIDYAIPQHPLSEVSTGECVAVILCGVYVGAHSLWRIRERLAPYDLATIMQDETFDLERFPEERLAKALDDLYVRGLDTLMSGIALEAIRQYGLDTKFLHFDTTSLSFYGAFEREGLGAGYDQPPPRVTFGYSKAKRPDLKQVMFGCLSSPDGGVPLLGKVLDGNCADSLAAAEFFGRVRELVADPREVCLVADSKGWCDRTLEVVHSGGMRLLSRLPRTEDLHRELMSKPWAPEVVIERPGRRKGEVERLELMGFDGNREITVDTGEKTVTGKPILTKITIPVRAVRVHSTALLKSKAATLARTREKESRKALAHIRDWQGIAYACAGDAKRAAERHIGQYTAITQNLVAEVVHHDGPAKRGRGRPRKRPEPALAAAEHWRVRYHINPVSEEESRLRLHNQASFILIRTTAPEWTITDAEMIEHYRQQYHLEHGFAWLKSGADINPMFIESPQRIASMGFIYCIGLMAWNLIQRTVRAHLVATKTGLPYHRRKLSDHITTRFLIELFPSVQTVVITDQNGQREKRTLGMGEWQKKAAEALGVAPETFRPVMSKLNAGLFH